MKRRLAKIIYWISGQLSRIKTSQKTYAYGENMEWVYAGKQKIPCTLSIKLLDKSMQLDWDHWDHWATVNNGTIRCECGGTK